MLPPGRVKAFILLAAGAAAYAALVAVLYRWSCLPVVRAANYNPMLRPGDIVDALYLHLASMIVLVLVSALAMVPYRAASLAGSIRRGAARLLGCEWLVLYTPVLVGGALAAVAYWWASGELASRLIYAASPASMLFSLLFIYASVFAVPWATARALLPSPPGRGRLILYGLASILAAKLAALLVSGLLARVWNPVVWGCSAEEAGVQVINPETSVIERLYTVDASLIASALITLALYYYLLVRMLRGARGDGAV